MVRHAHCLRAYIHGGDTGRTSLSRIEGEATCVGKAIQHMLTLGNFGHGLAIIFLVQKEAGLLAIFHIHRVFNAIFHNFCGHRAMLRQKRRGKPSLALLHAFQKANLHIIALEQSTNIFAHFLQNFNEQVEEQLLAQLDAQGQGLRN